MRVRLFFGSQEQPGSQQDPAGARRSQEACFPQLLPVTPLVSNGPMLRDLCNKTKRQFSSVCLTGPADQCGLLTSGTRNYSQLGAARGALDAFCGS